MHHLWWMGATAVCSTPLHNAVTAYTNTTRLLTQPSPVIVFLLGCLQAQLVMLGPIGDAWGLQATVRLQTLMTTFPGRVYAPPNKYCAGREKQLLLAGECPEITWPSHKPLRMLET
jgi:hypothetical protein